jgi:CRP/FNR family transcriptional regulator, anaerobic regulatory protein
MNLVTNLCATSPAALTLDGRACFAGDLLTGESTLATRFREGAPRLLRAGRPLAAAVQRGDVLYRLQAGWAYRFRELSDRHRAITDIYLPGDIMGFDSALCGKLPANVTTLTTAVIEVVNTEGGIGELMAVQPTGLYIAWLLNEQQCRMEALRAATACLDARGRLAAMVLDFHARLNAQGLITNATFSLPLTQHHIGSYLGLTVVHVNRVIRSLRDDAVVNIEKHCVTLLNLRALTGLAKASSATEQRKISTFPGTTLVLHS